MWSVDPIHGERFRDPRDVNQLSFEITDKPDLSLLKVQLRKLLSQRGSATITALKDVALFDTVFKSTHVMPAILAMEDDGEVTLRRARRHDEYQVYLSPPRLFSV